MIFGSTANRPRRLRCRREASRSFERPSGKGISSAGLASRSFRYTGSHFLASRNYLAALNWDLFDSAPEHKSRSVSCKGKHSGCSGLNPSHSVPLFHNLDHPRAGLDHPRFEHPLWWRERSVSSLTPPIPNIPGLRGINQPCIRRVGMWAEVLRSIQQSVQNGQFGGLLT